MITTVLVRHDNTRRISTTPHVSIREIHIEIPSGGEVRYDPPERVLNIGVVGENAFLQVQPCDGDGRLGEIESQFHVNAESLVRALQTLIEDQNAEK